MSVVFDSSALLAIAFEENGADVAARRLSGGIISAVNASEVVARFVDLGVSGEDARASLLGFGLETRLFDTALAVAAGLLLRMSSPGRYILDSEYSIPWPRNRDRRVPARPLRLERCAFRDRPAARARRPARSALEKVAPDTPRASPVLLTGPPP